MSHESFGFSWKKIREEVKDIGRRPTQRSLRRYVEFKKKVTHFPHLTHFESLSLAVLPPCWRLLGLQWNAHCLLALPAHFSTWEVIHWPHFSCSIPDLSPPENSSHGAFRWTKIVQIHLILCTSFPELMFKHPEFLAVWATGNLIYSSSVL